ncbi:MAG: Uma2 family endonuclease [Cytophagales bacterium]|nr:MAG: Uma2 family endonuclease [Cytophagales bacterium]
MFNQPMYEILNGKALNRRGYLDVLSGEKDLSEIAGHSSFKAALTSFILGKIATGVKKGRYLLATNQVGLTIDPGSELILDIAIFNRAGLALTEKYFDVPPLVAIEIDVNIEPEEFAGGETDYVHEKTQRLLDFGVERVIWVTTQPKKIFVATQTAPWLTQNWDADVPVLDDVVLNLAGLLKEEEIEV